MLEWVVILSISFSFSIAIFRGDDSPANLGVFTAAPSHGGRLMSPISPGSRGPGFGKAA